MRTFTTHPLVSAFLVLALFAAPIFPSYAATKGFPTTASVSELKKAYKDGEVKILIVPGHEPNYGGAVFMGVYEREIVVDIANKLATELRKDDNIEVVVARTNTKWNSSIQKYFDRNMSKISTWVGKQKTLMQKKVSSGAVKTLAAGDRVDHASAPSDVALRLYGLNKWANENDIDLVINVHINDAPDHGPTTPGPNTGYSIYVPDSQFGNGKASKTVANSVSKRLNEMTTKSTLRVENQGVVEDQELIAVGANNTLEVPTMLVEYGYITEARMLRPEVRSSLTTDFAYQTYLGLMDFFGTATGTKYATKSLPYTWSKSPSQGSAGADVYALQAALKYAGYYPPSESTLVECPVSGIMNECTTAALKAYQKAKKLTQSGTLDQKTRAALNKEFGK